ncbi:MAG: type IV secretory system conjugative DNA transfer family protein [Actinomycetota bacterium]|nr:type IV secretory system conjugative DNA transfer family protein [Actinomycetota bacterium]
MTRTDTRARPFSSAPVAAGGDDLVTDLVPWLLGIAAAVLVPVWAGAVLAAWLFGAGAGAVSLADAPLALSRLGSHLVAPADAWPPPARSNLPGPVPYWACQLVVLGVLAGMGWAGWCIRERLRSGSRGSHALGVQGEAGFAHRRDLGLLGVAGPETGRLTIGRAGGRLIACERDASLAVVGPTGCGKTAGFAIPALLEWEGPVIATSVKSDLLEATIAHRRSRGKVWVYDPTGCSGHGSSLWSPLDSCATWSGAMRVAAWMTEAAQPRLDSLADGDYWYSQARKGLAPYLHAAAVLKGGGMADVVRWVDSQEIDVVEKALAAEAQRLGAEIVNSVGSTPEAEQEWEELWSSSVTAHRQLLEGERLDTSWMDQPPDRWPAKATEEISAQVERRWQAAMLRRHPADARELLAPLVSARALWGKEKRLRGSVFATMENVLSGWADPGVRAAAARPAGKGDDGRHPDDRAEQRVDLATWLDGDNTIYVVATAHEQARLRPVLTVLVQQAVRAAYDRAAATKGGRLTKSCLVLLDEAGNIAPLRDLPGYASTARSHGISLVTVWQDLAQIRAAYSDRAQTVLNNHRAKLFGTGIADQSTLEYVSGLIGDEQRTERNLSSDLSGGRRTLSEHSTYRRAAPIDVLRRIRPGEGVLLYGSELPAHVRLRPWFSDAALRATAERTDQNSKERRWRARLRR